jgi:hypothetical protein
MRHAAFGAAADKMETTPTLIRSRCAAGHPVIAFAVAQQLRPTHLSRRYGQARTNVVGVVHLKPLFPEQVQTSNLSTPF